MHAKINRALLYLKRYARVLGLVIFVVILVNIDWRETAVLISRVHVGFLAAAAALFPLFVLLKALRWHVILKGQGIVYPVRKCYGAYLASNFLGVITPGRVGELTKAIYLKEDAGISYSRAFPSVIIDRLFDLAALALTAAAGVFMFMQDMRAAVAVVIAAVSLAVLLAALNLGRLDRALKAALIKRNRTNAYRKLRVFFLSFGAIKAGALAVSVVLTAAGVGLFFYICYLLAGALGIGLSYVLIAFSVSLANIFSLIPLSISGVGFRDFALIMAFGALGLSPESAVSFSFIFLLYFTGLWALTGWVAWNIKPLSMTRAELKEDSFERR